MRRETTAANFVPAQAERHGEMAQTVTADIYAVVIGATLVTLTAFAVGGSLAGWALAVVIVVSLALFIGLLALALLFLTGGFHAWLLARATVRKAELETEIQMEQLRLQADDNRYAAQLESVRLEVDGLRRRLLVDGGGQPVTVAPSFVPAAPDPTRQMALEWVATLYRGAHPDPDHIRPDGRIYNTTLPFSARGAWGATEKVHGKSFLLDHGIITEVDGGYALNVERYPTLAHLGRV